MCHCNLLKITVTLFTNTYSLRCWLCFLASQFIYLLANIFVCKIKLSNFAINLQGFLSIALFLVRAGKIIPQFLGEAIIFYLVGFYRRRKNVDCICIPALHKKTKAYFIHC